MLPLLTPENSCSTKLWCACSLSVDCVGQWLICPLQSQPLKDSSATIMRLPSVLYLLPSIVPLPQSPPPPAGNAESFAGLSSPASVALGPPQLTSGAVLTPLPARAVSSASAFNISILPGSAVSGAPGVCPGLIEDLDITGLGE